MPLVLVAFLALGGHPQASPIDKARIGQAERSAKAGWIRLNLKGKPADLGYQYGVLASAEIADAHEALRYLVKAETTKDWSWFRDAAQRLFLDKLDPEYREELQGQVEGLAAKGVHLDLVDVLAFNAYIELKDYYLPWRRGHPSDKQSCSAFVATGASTADGKVVMAHNLWWDPLMGQRFNLILDVTPAKGHRFIMDALAGFIHSGSDFALNQAGLLICETTISGFAGFDPAGKPEFVRMRKATQYASSLDEWVTIMKDGNNGGYANTWLLADTKTNEIGRLELGLKNVTFTRTKSGYFEGSNFPINPKLIAEEIPGGWNANPQSNNSERRRLRWQTLLTTHKGSINSELAKSFLADTIDSVTGRDAPSGGTLCGVWGDGGGAMNSKVATTDSVAKMSLWARMGFSNGHEELFGDNRPTPLLRDIVAQPWVLFD